MKTSTLIDTNVFIDILGNGPFAEASVAAVGREINNGRIIISAIVWAELTSPSVTEEELARRVTWLEPRREAFPSEAAFYAGRAHRIYRERGGRRQRTLPDFLIGAHAFVAGHRLLTRDPARYRSYFPDLDIIAPDTQP